MKDQHPRWLLDFLAGQQCLCFELPTKHQPCLTCRARAEKREPERQPTEPGEDK